MNEFHLRVVSAIVLAPVALAAVWAGGIAFALLVAVATAIMVVEWRTIIGVNDRPITVFLSGLAIGAAQLVAWRFGIVAGLAAVGIAVVGTVVAAVRLGARDKAGLLVVGCLYAGLPGLAAILVRGARSGLPPSPSSSPSSGPPTSAPISSDGSLVDRSSGRASARRRPGRALLAGLLRPSSRGFWSPS